MLTEELAATFPGGHVQFEYGSNEVSLGSIKDFVVERNVLIVWMKDMWRAPRQLSDDLEPITNLGPMRFFLADKPASYVPENRGAIGITLVNTGVRLTVYPKHVQPPWLKAA